MFRSSSNLLGRRREITELLWMLKTEGEEKTFAYLKKEIARRRREKDHF